MLFCKRNIVASLFLLFAFVSCERVFAQQPMRVRTAAYAHLPLCFEQNIGQADGKVQFISHSSGYTLFLSPNEAVFALHSAPSPLRIDKKSRKRFLLPQALNSPIRTSVVRMKLHGVSSNARLAGSDPLPGAANYFIGSDRSKWRTGVPLYAKVQSAEVFPGIDLVYYGNERQLEYDFIVKPGADPKSISLGFEGTQGVSMDAAGNLAMPTELGAMTLKKPVIYQMVGSNRKPVEGKYLLQAPSSIGVEVTDYDRTKPLIIDPVLVYGTYLGGSGDDGVYDLVVDSQGNAFLTGWTASSDFPVEGTPITPAPSGTYVGFVTKLNAAGNALLYSTYLGGTGGDFVSSIALDASGHVYIAGETGSSDFPVTTNAYQTAYVTGATQNGFVTKLSTDGQSLLYSTYLGGEAFDGVYDMAVDANQNAYVAGFTTSGSPTPFPTTSNALQTTLHSPNGNGFVARIDTTQSGSSSLVYSTFLGGSIAIAGDWDQASGIAVDANQNAYVVGMVSSSDFPVTPQTAYQTSVNPNGNAFLTQIDTTKSGSAGLIYSTIFGGTGNTDQASSVALDSAGKVYLTGGTGSGDFPTTTGVPNSGPGKVFVAKFDATKAHAASLVYSTLVGGSGGEFSYRVRTDPNGNAYISGWTWSSNFPVTADAVQSALGTGGQNSFVAAVSPDGSRVLFGTYLGGNGGLWYDFAAGLALDQNHNIYVAGATASANLQTTSGAFQTSFAGTSDGFVVKLTALGVPIISSLSPTSGVPGSTVTISGVNFGSSQGTSTVTFNGTLATPTSWSATSISVPVPGGATTGNVVVAISGVASNGVNFTVIPTPTITGVSPNSTGFGMPVTISGMNFGAIQGTSTVSFNGTSASTITSWSDTQIVAPVPSGATSGPVVVVVNSVQSNCNSSCQFTVIHPVITSVTPPAAPVGGSVTVAGSGFGSSQGTSQIQFNGASASVSYWSDTSISAVVLWTATSGPLTIVRSGVTSNSVQFNVEPLSITGISPSSAPVGASVVISGTGFGSVQSTSSVDFYGTAATVQSWSDSQITVVVPSGAPSGTVDVTVASIVVQGPLFTLTQTVQLTDSLGNTSSYNSALIGGAWRSASGQGSGCSTCTQRGNISYTYDSSGNALSRTDENGNTTTYTYDSNGNVLTVTVPVSPGHTATTTYTYNNFGEALTVTDPMGFVTTNTYDANGNLLSVTTPAPGGGASASVTQFAYNSLGELASITDPLTNVTALAYTTAGLIATITDAQSNVTSYGYDAHGNRTSVTDALQHQTTFAYDAADRLTTITYPDSTTTSFTYDYRGRRTSVTDQNGKTTTYAYDDSDRLISVTDAANNVTAYSYDTENNLTSIADANGHTTSFAYDAFGRVTQTTFPSGLVETYGYDAVGNLTGKTDRKNQLITYTYDQLNRLAQKSYPDTSTVNYTYDNDSRLTQVSDPMGTYQFTFDNMGRLTGTTTSYAFLTGRNFTASYAYDAASNRTGFTDPESGSTSYAYDTLNRLQTLTPPVAFTSGSFGLGYDALSRRTSLTRPNGVNTTYAYDNLSRLLSVLHKFGNTTLDGAAYTVDNGGNRTSKTDNRTGVTSNYAYDPIYELTGVTQGGATAESYSYDYVGNRLTSLGVPNYSYNVSNELTSSSNASYGYDANGNAVTRNDSSGITTFAWDYENRLTSVTLPGSGGTVSFKYDPFGRRIYKSSTTATSVYAYDGNNLVEETNSAGGVVARYSQNLSIDEPLAMLRSGATSFYNADGLGSITSLSNTAGALAQTYTFDSFGNQTASSGSLTNTFRYTARELDSETGLYFYRARYFDSSAGRFLSEDPMRFAIGPNFYAYVANDPTGQIDPSGLQQQQSPGGGAQQGPVYNPGTWNDPGHTHTNNCYSYACNSLHPPGTSDPSTWGKPQPGDAAGLQPQNFTNCTSIKVAARADGLKNGKNGECPCGFYKVRLYFTPNFMGSGFPDYHWYRQDSNGGWSSKHGWAPVGPQLPNTNAVDKDAASPASGGYGVFCGTMCVASH